jgi:hypothetical protein
MPIEVPGKIFDAWVTALGPLAERDVHPKTERHPNGGMRMTARQVLMYLQGSSVAGTHVDDIGRSVASGDVVVLDPDDQDAARARNAIRNAEALTGIKADEVGNPEAS